MNKIIFISIDIKLFKQELQLSVLKIFTYFNLINFFINLLYLCTKKYLHN